MAKINDFVFQSDSLYPKVRKNDFIRHIKQLNIGDQFSALDNDSDMYWHNVAVTAFKLVFVAIFKYLVAILKD